MGIEWVNDSNPNIIPEKGQCRQIVTDPKLYITKYISLQKRLIILKLRGSSGYPLH